MPPSPTSRPLSPTRASRHAGIPPGFIAPPRPKPRPLEQLSVQELRELQEKNARILASGSASTSTYIQRISREQASVEARLVQLGMDNIQNGMSNATISERMAVDPSQEPPLSRAIAAKQRALAKFNSHVTPGPNTLSYQEAAEIEKRAHAHDLMRKQKINERKLRQGIPIKGEVLTRAEMNAKMWAFLNYKPTDSDMEDDDDDSDSDSDPANWFVDEDDDGRKGQDIIEPDTEDYSNIIRIDHTRIPHNFLHEREGD